MTYFTIPSPHLISISEFRLQQNMVPGLYDPFGLSSRKTEEQLARGRDVEIKNGRLAMIGFMGLYAAATIDGAVPLQPDC